MEGRAESLAPGGSWECVMAFIISVAVSDGAHTVNSALAPPLFSPEFPSPRSLRQYLNISSIISTRNIFFLCVIASVFILNINVIHFSTLSIYIPLLINVRQSSGPVRTATALSLDELARKLISYP